MSDHLQLLGFAELMEALGVSRTRVAQLMVREDFPRPIAVLRMGQVWSHDDVAEFCGRTGRTMFPVGKTDVDDV